MSYSFTAGASSSRCFANVYLAVFSAHLQLFLLLLLSSRRVAF